MVALQKPKYAYYQGAIRPWDDCVIHVSSEAVFRGLNVFEGLKAYWQQDGSMGVIALRKHFDRFGRSAELLHMPFDWRYEDFENAVHEIIESLCVREQDIWIRATLYMIEGHWGENQKTDLVLQAFLMPKERPEPMKIGVSSWRRAADTMLPSRIKTSTNYQVARLAKIEGRSRGYPEMVILNNYDRVAETGGSCILMARDGTVATPPASEGNLESITVDIVEALARDLEIPFERRPIDRTELYIADEIALAGTLAEIIQVTSVDEHQCSNKTNVLRQLADAYWDAVTGVKPHPSVDPSCRKYARLSK